MRVKDSAGDTGALFQESCPVVSSVSTGSAFTVAPGLILPESSRMSWGFMRGSRTPKQKGQCDVLWFEPVLIYSSLPVLVGPKQLSTGL